MDLPVKAHGLLFFHMTNTEFEKRQQIVLSVFFPNIKILNSHLNEWILLQLHSIVPPLQVLGNLTFRQFPKPAAAPWSPATHTPVRQVSHSKAAPLPHVAVQYLVILQLTRFFIKQKSYEIEIGIRREIQIAKKRKLSPINSMTLQEFGLVFSFFFSLSFWLLFSQYEVMNLTIILWN